MGRATGIILMSLFGAAWAWLAAGVISAQPAQMVRLAAIVISIGLIVCAVLVHRRNRGGLRRTLDHRLMWIVIGGEFLILIVGANLLVRSPYRDWLMPAVALVVGLHFLPLAKAAQLPLYLVTGAAITVVAIISALFKEPIRTLMVGLGAASSLWITCAVLVSRARRG